MYITLFRPRIPDMICLIEVAASGTWFSSNIFVQYGIKWLTVFLDEFLNEEDSG